MISYTKITFKIEENKVPFIFFIELKWMGYGHFEFSKDLCLGVPGLNQRMARDPSCDL